MKYMLILLGVLLMAEVVQTDIRIGVRIGWGKKRALVPHLEDEALVDARNVLANPQVREELTEDLKNKIKAVVEKERNKFGF